ncbi:hypothetical protein KAS50_03130, partial [bacterium]|nr:hypothetical protein [bacterium]
NLPIVTDVGVRRARQSLGTVIYGCKNYDGLKVQDTANEEEWIKFARDRDGYIFRPVYNDKCDAYDYDGYIGIEGNKKQIDNENVPFILLAGRARENVPSCMVLFTEKDAKLTREKMWESILSRKAVGILPRGKMMGPESYRNLLQLLLLDRVYLEEYFGDRIHLKTEVADRELIVTITNTYSHSVKGILKIAPAPELNVIGSKEVQITLPAKRSRTIKFAITPELSAMGLANPIAVHYNWGKQRKSTLAVMDLPRAISVHQLLYGHEPVVVYPVTIHNFSDKAALPVEVEVYKKGERSKPVYSEVRELRVRPGKFKTAAFDLGLPAGGYDVKVIALGAENISQLGVGKKTGNPRLYEVDLDGDGTNEYRMENEHVQVTLLRIGARVIEFIVKDRNDNVFFKLWPEKEVTERMPFRKRRYYPYGGFEDFLGQPSIETHTVFDAEIIKSEGSFVRVRMTADYYGNILEKIFTLYGNSPLLEVRFALTFKNPEANMLGPQPILALGERHWTEDIFAVPSEEGIQKFRMRPEEYYGRIINLKEGWNAGYDEEADVSFVGAFPVSEPKFLHMWMNHPMNDGAQHYYLEFQPWVPIYQKSTMYFSYYLWASSGSWEKGVEDLRKRNLITEK